MAVYENGNALPRGPRSLRSKKEKRESLRLKIRQAEDPVGATPDSDSDSGSEDEAGESEDDSDDDVDAEEPEPTSPPQSDAPALEPSAPGFVTLVPPAGPAQPPSPTRISQPPAPPASEAPSGPISTLNPPAEKPSTTNRPSVPVEDPESIVNSVPDAEPTTFVSSTITTGPTDPSESSAIPEEEDPESLISDTSLLASTTAEPTSVPSEDVEQVGSNDGGSSVDRGADVGIIIGTMALAALIIAACVLFYRRRKKANQDHLSRLDEKPLPETPESGPGKGSNKLQFSSWPNFVGPNNDNAAGQGAAGFYNGNDKGGPPMSPAAPPTAHGAAGAFRLLTGQDPPPQMTSRYDGGAVEGRLVPPPTHLAPPTRTDVYPPGQVPIDQYRTQSIAQTEVTDSTEGTWRTWGVDQSQPKGKYAARQR